MPTTQISAGRAFSYLYNLGKNSVSRTGFMHPTALARGSGNMLYVASWGNEATPCARITKCTLDHEWIADIGGPGDGDGQFLCPGGLALDKDENIYVSDQSVHKIVMFDKDGGFLGKWGESGSADGQLNRPSGLAFDKDDNLYISDTLNNRIQQFSKDGKFIKAWGEKGSGNGQLNMPWGITVDKDGDVYVADWGNDRIQKFSSDGKYLASFGKSGDGKDELNRPSDVAVDKDGDVYIADWGNNRVQVYEPDGSYLVTLSGDAVEPSPWSKMVIDVNPDYIKARALANLEPLRKLRRPSAIEVDQEGQIIIAEAQHSRVQIYLKDTGYSEPALTL